MVIEADAILTRLYTTAMSTAVNLGNWGNTLLAVGNKPVALEKYRAAEELLCKLSITESYGPVVMTAAGISFREA